MVFASDKDRQGEILYWKNVINWGDEWKYRSGTSEPPVDWHTMTFDDSEWMTGSTGIGYGDDDDVTIIDPQFKWTIDVNKFKSKSRNCPYHGWTVKGKVETTIVGGEIRFEA